MSTIYYNKNGSEFLDDNNEHCAKKILLQNKKGKKIVTKYQYYIRQAIDGIESGRFFNPVSVYHVEGSSNGFSKDRGQNVYEYKKVNEEVFELYIKFLQTKNIAYLKNAERGMV